MQTLSLRTQIRLMVGFLIAINDKKANNRRFKKTVKLWKNIFKTPIAPNGLYLARIFLNEKIDFFNLFNSLFFTNSFAYQFALNSKDKKFNK